MTNEELIAAIRDIKSATYSGPDFLDSRLAFQRETP